MNNKNQVVIGMALALVAGGVVGYMAGSYQYSAQIEKAKKFFPVMADMRFLSGTVTKVSGDAVTITTQPSTNPFEDLPTTRVIVVGDKTKIVKQEQKDPKVFQEEMVDYQAAIKKIQGAASPSASGAAAPAPAAAANMPTMPAPFEEKTLGVSDLKAGDMISVEASQNIKTLTRFEATRITVNGSAAPAGTTAAPAAPGAAPIVNTPPPVNPNGPAPIIGPAPATTNLPPPAPPKP